MPKKHSIQCQIRQKNHSRVSFNLSDLYDHRSSDVTLLSFFLQKWKIMSCRMKIEQLREAVAGGVQEKKSGGC